MYFQRFTARVKLVPFPDPALIGILPQPGKPWELQAKRHQTIGAKEDATYPRNRANSPLALRNHGRSRRRKYPGMVGFFSRILCAHSLASAFRPCDSRNNA